MFELGGPGKGKLTINEFYTGNITSANFQQVFFSPA